MINATTGRVHTCYNQAVAITGRLASSDPNLQNIPVRSLEGRRIREAFIAPQGSHIVSADYSQIELRIMAHLSQDQGMLQAFANNEDIHRHTAAEVFGVERDAVDNEQRRYAKVINFRPDLRHECVWPGAKPEHRTQRCCQLYRTLFCALPGCKGLHAKHTRRS